MDPSESLIATHSGVRGKPGKELSDEVVFEAVAGLAGVLERRGLASSVALGRDERPSGNDLSRTAIEAALERGLDVVDLGIASSPATKLAARRSGLGGAVIVTGSHLDPDLNGVKLVAGPSYGPVDVRRLKPPRSRSARRGRLRRDSSAAERHVAVVCESVDADAVRRAGMRVRVRGGAGDAPRLMLERLGCDRDEAEFDVGLTLDADADRLSLTDEEGRDLDTEVVLALALLAHDARRIVKGADTSRMIDALAHERGGAVTTVTPGEIHLVAGIAAEGADLAGEGNGGVIVPAVGLARDGLAAAAAVLWLLARRRRPLSALVGELPPYEIRRTAIPLQAGREHRGALERLASRYGSELRSPEQGVLVERDDGAWALVRASATEPVIRITAEGPAAGRAAELRDELAADLCRNGRLG